MPDGGLGQDAAAVGVPREDDRPVDRVEDVADVGGVALQAAQRVGDARDVVAAMHEVAARESVTALTPAHLEQMRAANARFATAVEAGDVEAALAADDELHGVLVRLAGNHALETVLEQFTPVIRRAEMLRFGSIDGRASVSQHDELIRLCAAGDAEAVAAIAYDTWHSLPSGTVPPGDEA